MRPRLPPPSQGRPLAWGGVSHFKKWHRLEASTAVGLGAHIRQLLATFARKLLPRLASEIKDRATSCQLKLSLSL